MNNFVSMISGTSYDKNHITNAGLRVLRGGNIQSFKLLMNNDDVFLPISYLNTHSLIRKSDILIVASTGSKEVIGKPAFVESEYPNTTIGAFLRIVRPFSKDCFEYLKVIFKSEYYRNIVRESVRGTNINNLKANTILDIYVPLPPYNEQLHIVEKINSLEPFIEKYAQVESKITALEEEFPDKLKKSILQYAIEGKLVKQDPNDEPASVLLERIKAEKEKLIKEGKIKRDKNESYIYQGDDKNYYENLKLNWPISWVVQPLKNVLLPMESCKPNGESFEYIDIESIDNKSNCIASSKTIKSSDAPSRATRKLSDGDVLFSIVRPYLKNIAIVSKSFAKCIGSTGFYVCKPIKLLKTQFLYYFLLSPYCIDGIMPFMKGDNSPSIRGTDLERLYIGFPAFNEQEKIVKKIIYLFEKIDNQSY